MGKGRWSSWVYMEVVRSLIRHVPRNGWMCTLALLTVLPTVSDCLFEIREHVGVSELDVRSSNA